MTKIFQNQLRNNRLRKKKTIKSKKTLRWLMKRMKTRKRVISLSLRMLKLMKNLRINRKKSQ